MPFLETLLAMEEGEKISLFKILMAQEITRTVKHTKKVKNL